MCFCSLSKWLALFFIFFWGCLCFQRKFHNFFFLMNKNSPTQIIIEEDGKPSVQLLPKPVVVVAGKRPQLNATTLRREVAKLRRQVANTEAQVDGMASEVLRYKDAAERAARKLAGLASIMSQEAGAINAFLREYWSNDKISHWKRMEDDFRSPTYEEEVIGDDPEPDLPDTLVDPPLPFLQKSPGFIVLKKKPAVKERDESEVTFYDSPIKKVKQEVSCKGTFSCSLAPPSTNSNENDFMDDLDFAHPNLFSAKSEDGDDGLPRF